VPDELAVWLNDVCVATITEARGRLALAYTDGAFARFPLGAPVLCLALPMIRQRYTHGAVRPFVDGLLPEGEARRAVASDLGLSRDDAYGLIGALGRDCAGALVIQPADDPPPRRPTVRSAEELTEEEIAGLVANLRSAPLGVGAHVRLSLAGVQEKLLLTRTAEGAWGRPVDGTPSTHILKPEIVGYPQTVENEAFCMRFARHLGLPVAPVDTTTVAGRRLIVIERYDRIVHADGSIDRLHQEDLCQAVGVLPEKKYEEDGGPSLVRIAELLQLVATSASVDTLLAACTVNVLVGNGDAHGKNFSLLHDPAGTLSLAPLYDLMCTLFYGDDRLAMYVDNVRRTDRVTVERIVNEAVRWGMRRSRATDLVLDLLDRTPAAVAAASDETPGLPPQIPDLVLAQLRQVRAG
jgi:serine/threonine-protein kinase HipA